MFLKKNIFRHNHNVFKRGKLGSETGHAATARAHVNARFCPQVNDIGGIKVRGRDRDSLSSFESIVFLSIFLFNTYFP